MPIGPPKSAEFTAERKDWKALCDGLPDEPLLGKRLPIFYEAFSASKSAIESNGGPSRDTLLNWEKGEVKPTKLDNLFRAAKKVLIAHGCPENLAMNVATWLARGSPPTKTGAKKKAPAAPENTQETAEAVASNSFKTSEDSPSSAKPSVASEMNSLLDEAERWVAETPFEQFLLNQKATVEILEANLVELERKLVSDEAMHNARMQSILRQQACELIAWIREPECGNVHQSAHELGEVAQKLRQADETLEQLRQLEPIHQRFRALKHAVATRIRSRFGGVIESEHVPGALIKGDDGTVRWVKIG